METCIITDIDSIFLRYLLGLKRSQKEMYEMMKDIKDDIKSMKETMSKGGFGVHGNKADLQKLIPSLPLTTEEGLAQMESLLMDNVDACSYMVTYAGFD